MITKEMTIEELVSNYPKSIGLLAEKGIRCIRCGEPLWGTIETAARDKGFSDKEISDLMVELNQKLTDEN